MKRRYFVQTIDRRTGEPAFMGEIEDETLLDAAQEGQRRGAMHAGHPEVETTHVSEVEPSATAAVVHNLRAGTQRVAPVGPFRRRVAA